MKSVLLLLVTIVCVSLLKSQNIQSKAEPLNWGFGIDLLPLIGKNQILSNAFLVKRKITDNLILRSKFGWKFEDRNNRSTTNPEATLTQGSDYVLYFDFGIEKYKAISNHLYFAYGVVLSGYRQWTSNISEGFLPGQEWYRWRKVYEQSLTLNPLVSSNIRLFDNNLLLSLETELRIGLSQNKETSEDWERGVLKSYGGGIINRIITDVKPISSINLIYQF